MIPRITLYRNPNTSESSDEFETLVEGLVAEPSVGAELCANGYVLAKATEAGGRLGWLVTDEGIERFREEQK